MPESRGRIAFTPERRARAVQSAEGSSIKATTETAADSPPEVSLSRSRSTTSGCSCAAYCASAGGPWRLPASLTDGACFSKASRPARRTVEAAANSTRMTPPPFLFVIYILFRGTLSQVDRQLERRASADQPCAELVVDFCRSQQILNVFCVQNRPAL